MDFLSRIKDTQLLRLLFYRIFDVPIANQCYFALLE